MVGTTGFFKILFYEKAYCLPKYLSAPPKNGTTAMAFFPAEKNLQGRFYKHPGKPFPGVGSLREFLSEMYMEHDW